MTETEDMIIEEPESSKVKKKRGIIYLSSIPPYFNVSKIRETFGQFGTVGRVYLELADKDSKPSEKKSKKRKVAKKFLEGWVEFEKKSVAKKVASFLNNAQVSTRKKSKQFDCMWNIKYLSGFKWTHLHERLAYEKAARRQKLRAEIQLAKKKTNIFTLNIGNKKKKDVVNKELGNVNKNKQVGKSTEKVDTEDRKQFLTSLL